MPERKPNNYASQVLLILYLVGTASATPWGSDWNWPQAWRAVIWPYYITWVEVGDYIERRAALARAEQEGGR